MTQFFRWLMACVLLPCSIHVCAQSCYWQQRVAYDMKVSLDVKTNLLAGTQHLQYWNNSPDTLHHLFYHLYWNAFHPGSMMDMRSRTARQTILFIGAHGDTVRDWDPRVADRISRLTPDQMGYDSVTRVLVNGRPRPFKIQETIMEVALDKPILPHTSCTIDLLFKCQVNIQIRRSGRDNAEGVRYSMSQWYPKICEYDTHGWHPTPYVAREFYGVWGDYDVSITLDSSYLVGGTGYLQNAGEIGDGYEVPGTLVRRGQGKTLTWHFHAPLIHDFMWAADPAYRHISRRQNNAAHTLIQVIYKENPATDHNWQVLLQAASRVLPYMEYQFGPYPYKQYSFIQGGDGGMEYPMATLIKNSSLGDAFHEWMHSWYQMMLGTNESTVPWMDEGFTTYGEGKISYFYFHAFADSLFADNPAQRQKTLDRMDQNLPLGEGNAYRGYFELVQSGLAEPMTTHADHYLTNFAYEENAYSKGAVFLEQLGYLVGDTVLHRILLEYYRQWRFRHPDADDFIRIAQQVSGLQLDWYQEYWINTTKTIDYGIDSLLGKGDSTLLCLSNDGTMPMPLDLVITYRDGHREAAYIPMDLIYGIKPSEDPATVRRIYSPWPWTNPRDTIVLPSRLADIRSVEIDPSRRMADINRTNNIAEAGSQ
jgi:hypothetical protein